MGITISGFADRAPETKNLIRPYVATTLHINEKYLEKLMFFSSFIGSASYRNIWLKLTQLLTREPIFLNYLKFYFLTENENLFIVFRVHVGANRVAAEVKSIQ